MSRFRYIRRSILKPSKVAEQSKKAKKEIKMAILGGLVILGVVISAVVGGRKS